MIKKGGKTTKNEPLEEDAELNIKAVPMSPTGIMRRTFFDRTFSPLGAGSIRGSIFQLSASAIGSGVMSLPYVLALCGYAGGITLLTIAALAARTALSMLAYLACEHDLKNYSQITYKAGGKAAARTLAIMTIVFQFGSSISYQIMITSLFRYVFK